MPRFTRLERKISIGIRGASKYPDTQTLVETVGRYSIILLMCHKCLAEITSESLPRTSLTSNYHFALKSMNFLKHTIEACNAQ